MKNIDTILADFELSDEQKTAICSAVNENYKTIAEFDKKDSKISNLTEKLNLAEETLKTFEGIDAEGMKKQIADLTEALTKKDAEFTERMAERDFTDLLNAEIVQAKGINAKAITSLLDVPTLRASQNQKEDIANALKVLAEAEDSKMLFQTEETKKHITNPIGSMGRTTTLNPIDDKYKGNPWYKPSGN